MDIEEFERIFRPQHASAGPHTLDSPVRYEVWKSYAIRGPNEYADLLLEPMAEATTTLAAVLSQQWLERSGLDLHKAAPAMTAGLIAIRLPFDAFIETVIPLTTWRDLTALGQELTVDHAVGHWSAGGDHLGRRWSWV
jgi:hypothetical protein